MEEIKLGAKKTVRFVTDDGRTVDATRPLLKQLRAFEVAIDEARKEKSGTGATDATIDLLMGCGLPREFIEDLDAENLQTVADALVSKKKG